MASEEIDHLVHLLSRLPGTGKRSAKRMVLHLIKHKTDLMEPLIHQLDKTCKNTQTCHTCGNIDTVNPCDICQNHTRTQSEQICVVEDVADLWAIERSNIFKGTYHVLGGTLSAIDGRGPEDLRIESLIQRTANDHITEVILATNATVEGQTTAHYIAERFEDQSIMISRLAYGIPIGGELDYLDEGTLGAALNARKSF